MTQLHRRIQDPAFSDYRTLRVDAIGESALLGRVYLSTATGGSPLDVVQCDGRPYLAYRASDGRLYAAEVPDYVATMALKAVRVGRATARNGYTARPES